MASGFVLGFVVFWLITRILYVSLFFNNHLQILKVAYQIATIFWTGFSHFPGQLKATNVSRLPHTRAFYPVVDRGWLIDFWNLEIKWIFVALPVGFLLMLLFYYDHVSVFTTRLYFLGLINGHRIKVALQHKRSNSPSRNRAAFIGISSSSVAQASLQESLIYLCLTD